MNYKQSLFMQIKINMPLYYLFISGPVDILEFSSSVAMKLLQQKIKHIPESRTKKVLPSVKNEHELYASFKEQLIL